MRPVPINKREGGIKGGRKGEKDKVRLFFSKKAWGPVYKLPSGRFLLGSVMCA